jgi:hypothetical protein
LPFSWLWSGDKESLLDKTSFRLNLCLGLPTPRTMGVYQDTWHHLVIFHSLTPTLFLGHKYPLEVFIIESNLSPPVKSPNAMVPNWDDPAWNLPYQVLTAGIKYIFH